MIGNIITGVVGGLAYSLSGLANKSKRETFDWKKMVPTLVIAAVIGGIAGVTGQDYGIVANGAMAAGITVIIQKFYSSVKKKIVKK